MGPLVEGERVVVVVIATRVITSSQNFSVVANGILQLPTTHMSSSSSSVVMLLVAPRPTPHTSAGLLHTGMDQSCGVDGSCSSHGACVSMQCACQQGWSGFNCEVQSESRCPLSCSGKGSCSSTGTCSCNAGYYGSGCEYSFCSEETINADSGLILDRTANSPFPLMTAKSCSWTISVSPGKQASVALQLLHDTSQRFMILVVDGAYTASQVMDMKLEDLAPLVLGTTFPAYFLNTLSYLSVLPINCNNSLWTGGKPRRPPACDISQTDPLLQHQPPSRVSPSSRPRIPYLCFFSLHIRCFMDQSYLRSPPPASDFHSVQSRAGVLVA